MGFWVFDFHTQTQQKLLCSLPYVLSINCQIENDADREFWQLPQNEQTHGSTTLTRLIPMSMRLELKEDSYGRSLDIHVQEISSGAVEEENKTEEDGEGDRCSGDYELVMAVGHVKEAWMEVPGNLVAHIRVGPSYHLRKEVSFVQLVKIVLVS